MLKEHLMVHISLDLLAVVRMVIPNIFPVSAPRQFMLKPPYTVCVMLMLFYISGLAAEQQLCNFSNGLQFTKRISTIFA
jgi:Ca2+/H+ antiporter